MEFVVNPLKSIMIAKKVEENKLAIKCALLLLRRFSNEKTELFCSELPCYLVHITTKLNHVGKE